jgi:hypothetical protein
MDISRVDKSNAPQSWPLKTDEKLHQSHGIPAEIRLDSSYNASDLASLEVIHGRRNCVA